MTEETPAVEPVVVKPRRIAMVGCAPSTRNDAPWNEESWELWSQSEAYQVPRVTRWHELQTLGNLKAGYPDYYDWLTKLDKPIHMRQHFPEIPNSIPVQRDRFEFEYPREMLSSTLAWMLAEAIHQHSIGLTVEVIGLWGYDMAMDQEFFSQRPGLIFLTWVAQKHGIKVYIPKGSDLAISPMSYPFFTDDPNLAKVRARIGDINKKLGVCDADMRKAEMVMERRRAEKNYLNGAMEQLGYDERRLTGSIRPI